MKTLALCFLTLVCTSSFASNLTVGQNVIHKGNKKNATLLSIKGEAVFIKYNHNKLIVPYKAEAIAEEVTCGTKYCKGMIVRHAGNKMLAIVDSVYSDGTVKVSFLEEQKSTLSNFNEAELLEIDNSTLKFSGGDAYGPLKLIDP